MPTPTVFRAAMAFVALPLLLAGMLARAEFDPIGSITATVDGVERTWYIPGETGTDGGSGAMWMEVEPGTGTAVLGGFESRSVTFGRDAQTGAPVVSGEGSQISLSFQFAQGVQSLQAKLPGNGDDQVSLLLLPTAGSYAVMHSMEEGHLNVTTLRANRSGDSSFSGEFHGVLMDRDGALVHRFENGRFSVSNAQFFDLEGATGP